MEWVETTGRTIEEAKEAALDQLGVDETDAEFVMVSEPRAGLFGRMRGEARVRARVRPTSPRPKRGRSRRPAQEGRRESNGRSNSGRGGSRSTSVVQDAPPEVDGDLVDAAPSRNGSGGQNQAPRNRSRNRGSRGGGRSSGSGTERNSNG